jgi:hypothetical protein
MRANYWWPKIGRLRPFTGSLMRLWAGLIAKVPAMPITPPLLEPMAPSTFTRLLIAGMRNYYILYLTLNQCDKKLSLIYLQSHPFLVSNSNSQPLWVLSG